MFENGNSGWHEPTCLLHNASDYMHGIGGMLVFHYIVVGWVFIARVNLFVRYFECVWFSFDIQTPNVIFGTTLHVHNMFLYKTIGFIREKIN